MSGKLHPTDRSPLCPFALRLRDVQPGAGFVSFNLALGILERGIFLDHPHDYSYYNPESSIGGLWVLTSIKKVRTLQALWDMGIIAESEAWNDRNFAVKPQKIHLLPKPNEKMRIADREAREWESDAYVW